MTHPAPLVRQFATGNAPHRPPAANVRGMMLEVLAALIPGIAAATWVFGIGVLVQIALAVLFALLIEATCLHLRQRPLQPFVSDGSAVLTAVLYALCLPPTMPWWSSAVGMLFAIAVAKHLYGGLGGNVLNPAMVGYVVMLLAFPRLTTEWPLPAALASEPMSAVESLRQIFLGEQPARWDALSGATLLDSVRNLSEQQYLFAEIRDMAPYSAPAGPGWNLIAAGWLLGGLWLLVRKVISPHVPLAMLAGCVVITLPFWALDASVHPAPLFHLFAGGLMLAAFFIATDPVSGASTPRGRILFGLGVVVITLAIRRWGGYPDGVAFAVLLMNLLVPLLDRYTVPTSYGHVR